MADFTITLKETGGTFNAEFGEYIEGGGSSVTVTPLTVTENGTYDAGTNAAYNPVTVNVEDKLGPVLAGTATEIESDVTYLRGYIFFNFTTPFSVKFPEVINSGYQCFDGAGVTSVEMPKLKIVQTRMFWNCRSLISVDLSGAETITGSNACFQGCSALPRIELPSLTYINARGHFSNCTSLEYADLGLASSVPGNCFSDCTALVALVLRKTDSIASLTNISAFTGTPIESGTGYIYVPDALVNTYKAATGWSTYASQIKGLSELPTT